MSTTITIRTDDTLRTELEKRAEVSGKNLSEVVREILRESLTPRPMRERIGHLAGRLELPRDDVEPWRRKLRERNWHS